jgi:hypothetical protein
VPIKYRVVVKGAGKVYHGASEDEARRKFNLFVKASKKSKSAAVTLFKEYEIVRENLAPRAQRSRRIRNDAPALASITVSCHELSVVPSEANLQF